MFSKLILTVLAAASAALAAPLEARQSPSYFTPSATFQYSVRDGAIYPAGWGYVAKYPQNQGYDYTTLLTFTYPQAVAGRKCRLEFVADSGSVYAYGSRQLDVFTSLRPAPAGGASGWPPGNQRDANLGRLAVPESGAATWSAKYGAYLTEFTDCKAPGTVQGLELVGVSDEDIVSFPPSAVRIAYQ
ncbi:hypothetical protein CkaCkLH20_01851 [Colletotrichum karsti]|uniref:Ubiquitin 3 binding protein But2 C-terminal domain-containing protein n=1 Tax=Colletotrichum karsti TaxID=1095194 RepID=A0A9P6IE77_9PEZI|nr:uncharacterized protein CkaCkLH20_01851 [Colletotrichum karsti]KAF9880809.1 hypothetical protein CkaCkLH20_01851 [Colletotrichum karsti]